MRLEGRWNAGHFVCVGLDPDYERLPEAVRRRHSRAEAFVAFNQAIIDATAELACAFKPNAAFVRGRRSPMARWHWRRPWPTSRRRTRQSPSSTTPSAATSGTPISRVYTRSIRCIGCRCADDPRVLRAGGGPTIPRPLGPWDHRHGEQFHTPATVADVPRPPRSASCRPSRSTRSLSPADVATRWNTHGNCALAVGAPYPEKIARSGKSRPISHLLILGIGAQGAHGGPAPSGRRKIDAGKE